MEIIVQHRSKERRQSHDTKTFFSLAGGQLLRWINQECEAQVIYPLRTDQHLIMVKDISVLIIQFG